MNTKLMQLTLLSLLVFQVTGQAVAETIETVERKVDYSDLDLKRAEDAEEMLERLGRAARSACAGDPRGQPYYDVAPIAIRERFERCRHDALQKAVLDLDSPLVARAYQAAQEAGGRELAEQQ